MKNQIKKVSYGPLSLTLMVIILSMACSRVPLTGRRQVSLLPESSLVSMALTNYNDFLSENPPLPDNDPRQQMVRQVGRNIAGAVQQYMRQNGQADRVENFNWEFNVIEDEARNAWAMPGGKVVFYTGILPVTENETGVAVVMAHEIAHAVARHGNERMSQQMVLQLGAMGLDLALNEKPEETRNIFMAAYGVGGALGSLAYSRQHELEADRLGMIFMAMAGYNPNKALAFWSRMAEQSQGGSPPELLSTHPSDETRIEAVKKHLPEALKYYNSQ
ncbi:MAG: M48 family metallopeptidase [Bacteroidales bacterium]